MERLGMLCLIFLIGTAFSAPVKEVPAVELDNAMPYALAGSALEVRENQSIIFAVDFSVHDEAVLKKYGPNRYLWLQFNNTNKTIALSGHEGGGICDGCGDCSFNDNEYRVFDCSNCICGIFYSVKVGTQKPAELKKIMFGNATAYGTIWEG